MDKIEPKIISEISSSLEIDLTSKESPDEIRSALTAHINYLITHDFNKLVAILYRIDVSENLLKKRLELEGKEAATVIADMVIERQIQKVRSRQQFKSSGDSATDEKW